MKKKILIALLVVLVLAATASLVWAKGGGPSGPSGNSNVAHLYLHEKDGEPEWNIVEDGAWGKMKYNLSGPTFDFVFNGHGLDVGVDYSLIYYKDPWPGTPAKCLASGTANEGGNVHLADSFDLGMDLKDSGDENDGTVGAKIWLVLSDDVECEVGMTGWNPTEYLFEGDGIFFTDTDAPPAP